MIVKGYVKTKSKVKIIKNRYFNDRYLIKENCTAYDKNIAIIRILLSCLFG